ncbi:MAG: SurA N-terminal domain-containing protein [Hyphomicrobiaceae bacterium]
MALAATRVRLHGSPHRKPAPRLVALALAALVLVSLAGFVTAPGRAAESEQAILAVVNDEPISAYDVNQRVAMLMLSGAGGDVNAKLRAELKSKGINDRFRAFALKYKPQSQAEVEALQKRFIEMLRQQAMASVKPGLRDQALADLVADRVKLQEAKRLNLTVTEDEVGSVIANLARGNKMTEQQFADMLKSRGINIRAFRERIRVQIAWRRVLGRRFFSQVSVAQSEIDAAVSASSVGEEGAEGAGELLNVSRVTFSMRGRVDEARMAAQYSVAEQLSASAKGCDGLQAGARRLEGARFEALRKVAVADIPDAARPLVANAEVGQVTAPILTPSGIEVYAVCSREAASGEGSAAQRKDAESKLEMQKMEALSKGLISELCASAVIEFRQGVKPKRRCSIE